MSLPQNTRKAIENALFQTEQSPHYLDSESHREEIYSTFGSVEIDEYTKEGTWYLSLSQGAKIIGWLAVLTAQKVLPIWIEYNKERSNLNNSSIDIARIIQISKKILLNDINADAAKEAVLGEFYYGIAGLERETTKNVYYVVMTAYTTLELVIYGLEAAKYKEQDFALLAMKAYSTVDQNEAGLWQYEESLATSGFSNSSTSEESFSDFSSEINENLEKLLSISVAQERKKVKQLVPIKIDSVKAGQFWKWWLIEAIPDAWKLANQSSSQ